MTIRADQYADPEMFDARHHMFVPLSTAPPYHALLMFSGVVALTFSGPGAHTLDWHRDTLEIGIEQDIGNALASVTYPHVHGQVWGIQSVEQYVTFATVSASTAANSAGMGRAVDRFGMQGPNWNSTILVDLAAYAAESILRVSYQAHLEVTLDEWTPR
jgi:hypothetical protein